MIDYNKLNNEELCELYQSGDETALHYLCVNNHGLMEKIANGYFGTYNNTLDYDDLVQLAYVGMILSARRYKSDKGSKFVTFCYQYSQWIIHRAISRNGYIMNLTAPTWSKLQQIMKLKSQYMLTIHDENEIKKQIAKDMRIAPKKFETYWHYIVNIMTYATLSAPTGEDDDETLLDWIVDDNNPEDIVVKSSISDSLDIILNKLPEREKDIITMHYYSEMTLDKIAQIMKISKERVRQIEKKALKRLQILARKYDLQIYLT